MNQNEILKTFDAFVDRRRSGSYKWDGHDDSDDTIEMWVADMDFRTAPAIINALRRRVDHGVFGYTHVPDEYYNALTSWFERRHAYRFEREAVIYTSGVVPAISAIIKALAKPGEGVILNTPAYNCFFSSIRNNGCRVIESPLVSNDNGDGTISYTIDFDDLERKAAEPNNTLLILCNPHNPSGRIWSADELKRIAEISQANNVRVISDEIHCELTMPGLEYVPYAIIDPTAVIANSPSKAFNTAGLQIANIICPDEHTRALIDRAININEVCDVNPFGVTGLMAAYNESEAWLDALRVYLKRNYDYLCAFFRRELPAYPFTRLEATYLVWVDISASGMDGDALEEYLTHSQHVRLNGGKMYGDNNFARINIALPFDVLKEGLERISRGLKAL